MGLDHFFDKNLVFCLEADNQEQLFDQVATLLEEREIVTPTYREALITREKSFPTGLDMEFLGKDLPNVAIPHTDIVHNLAEKVVVVRLEKPVTFHNMIAPDKEVEVSLLFFIINNSSSSQTNILAQLMDFFTGNGHLEDRSNISEPEVLYAYIAEATAYSCLLNIKSEEIHMIKILAACGAGVNSSHQIKSALEEELSNRGFDVHCDAVMVKDVNEDLIKGYDIFTPIAATDLGFDPGIPVIEAGPILFRIPAMSAPVFDNIEAAIKEHGLS